MREYLAALALTAIAGCEEPRFEGEIDAYAPACNNRPYVTIDFSDYSVSCAGYLYKYHQDAIRCRASLELAAEPCITLWDDGNCDDAPDYWKKACVELDEEGELLSSSYASNKPPTEEQRAEFADALEAIGNSAARQKWIGWNAQ